MADPAHLAAPLACPACGAQAGLFRWRDRNRRDALDIWADTYECPACRSLYLGPVDADTTTLLNERTTVITRPPRWIRAIDRVIDLWADLWSPGFRWRGEPSEAGHGRAMLSIGCGYAANLQKYADRGWAVHGIDPNEEAVAWNREHVSGIFTAGLFEDIEFADAYDVIHCSAVIEHVTDPVAFLAKAAALLRPGGRLLFYTPNGRSAMTLLLGKYAIGCWVPFHVVLFSPEGMRIAAERAGVRARVHTVADPHLASMSIRQWRLRHRPGFRLDRGWDTRLTTPFLAPAWWLLNRFGLGEELVLEAVSPASR